MCQWLHHQGDGGGANDMTQRHILVWPFGVPDGAPLTSERLAEILACDATLGVPVSVGFEFESASPTGYISHIVAWASLWENEQGLVAGVDLRDEHYLGFTHLVPCALVTAGAPWRVLSLGLTDTPELGFLPMRPVAAPAP